MLIWKRNTFVIWICIRSRGSESSLASWTRCLRGKLRNETKRTKQTRATEGTHVGSFGSSRSTHGHIDIERGLKRLERSCMCETQGQLQVSPYCLLCWWTWWQHKCRFHIFWYWRNYVRVRKTVQWNCIQVQHKSEHNAKSFARNAQVHLLQLRRLPQCQQHGRAIHESWWTLWLCTNAKWEIQRAWAHFRQHHCTTSQESVAQCW